MRAMEVANKPEMTLGLDMDDRYSHYCFGKKILSR
jgi:hypothetical protein